jgi:hypothetical protein
MLRYRTGRLSIRRKRVGDKFRTKQNGFDKASFEVEDGHPGLFLNGDSGFGQGRVDTQGNRAM